MRPRDGRSALLTRRRVLPACVAVGEDPVEVPSGGAQHLAGPPHLCLAAGPHDLREGEGDLAHELGELVGLAADVAAHLVPRRRLVAAALLYELPSPVRGGGQLAPGVV